jgi:hypothetical protein
MIGAEKRDFVAPKARIGMKFFELTLWEKSKTKLG